MHEELLAKNGKYAAVWNAEQKISAWSRKEFCKGEREQPGPEPEYIV